MKNVTDSLRPSTSTAVGAPKYKADWSGREFTLTVPLYASTMRSYNDHMAELSELKKEAISLGFSTEEWTSMETMNSYIRFFRSAPVIPAKHNRLEESAPIEAEEVIEVKKIV